MPHSNDQVLRGRFDNEFFMALCRSQHTQKELMEAVESVVFTAWVNFTQDCKKKKVTIPVDEELYEKLYKKLYEKAYDLSD